MAKTCTKCQQLKEFSEFYTRKAMRDGHTSHCKECIRTKNMDWYTTSSYKDRRLPQVRNKPKAAAWSVGYYKENKDQFVAQTAKRRAKKLNATPDWLTKEHLEDIKSMYSLSKKLETLCGLKYHVDHIVPLQGGNVCGLHVPWNLQILEASINLSKGNSHR